MLGTCCRRTHERHDVGGAAGTPQECAAGSLTSYKALSRHFYGHDHATQAVVAMLRGAVSADEQHTLWMNRVVGADSRVVDANGQPKQLKEEGWSLAKKEP